MATPFNFTEEKHAVFYHDLKIYIAGADVTPWLVGSANIKRSDRGGVTSCTFTLSNQQSAFTMVEQNLNPTGSQPQFRLSDPYSLEGQYSEQAKAIIWGLKTRNNINVKHEIQSFGPVQGSKFTGGYILKSKAKVDSNQATSTFVDRFPFTPGSLVFHKYDPVRVFMVNPFKQTDDEWVCIFTGYLDTKPFQTDFLTGSSIINISCQDIRVLMNAMRTQVNSFAQYGNENVLQAGGRASNSIDAGFFNDLNVPGRQISHVLGGRTWLGSIEFLIFGNSGSKTYGQIGDLQRGETKTYSPDQKGREATLEDWNNLIMFGTTRTWLTKAQMRKLGETTFPGQAGSPDTQKVHFLLPAEGLPTHNLITYNVDSQISARIEWVSRLELITRLCKDLDYQFYISGIGDLIFEFPMYDFSPPDYGPTYNRLYSFAAHILNDNVNDEGGTPISALEITSRYLRDEIADNHPSTPGTNTGVQIPQELRRVIYSNVLASRFGVQLETYHVPGVVNHSRLAQIGAIEFNKRLANFSNFELSTAYRPFIGLNRPIYNAIRTRMGITTSVNDNFVVRESASVSMDLSYVRRQQSDGTWKFITGGEASPISYSKLYSGKTIVPNQGFGLDGVDTGNPTSYALDGAQ